MVPRSAVAPDHLFDLARSPLRELNARLHLFTGSSETSHWRVINPRGAHAVVAGLDAPVTVAVDGHVGYYCAGMNKRATVVVNGNAGVGVAENMMSGEVRIRGDVSQNAGASAHGGMLVIEGNAAARCGISMKGVNIIVQGSVGHMSAFMAQAGTLTVLGDAGNDLGDSIYEARLFVRGSVASLGSDCIEKPLHEHHRRSLHALLDAAGCAGGVDITSFRRYGSARRLYHFHVDNIGVY